MLSDSQLEKALSIALEATNIAAKIINTALAHKSSSSVTFQEKSSMADLVTVYDQQCEKEVIEYLTKVTPEFAIVSEETKSKECITDAPTWVVDPIDGTMSFIHGMFDCCVSIGLVVNHIPMVGVVHAPQIQEVFTAIKGKGAFLNGKRIFVSRTPTLKKAIVLNHYSSHRTVTAVNSILGMHRELLLIPIHSIRCHGSGALDMCLVASGRAEVFVDTETHPWDIAAGTVIVREAGGVVHDVDDEKNFDITSRGVMCGNRLHLTAPVVKLVKKYGYRDAVVNKL
eukprot:gene4012-2866_t